VIKIIPIYIYINSEIHVSGINQAKFSYNNFTSKKTDVNIYIKATKPIYRNNKKIPKNITKYSGIYMNNNEKNKQNVIII